MTNPPDTVERSEELLRVLEPIRAQLHRIPGCNGSGIGMSEAAFARHRAEQARPESVRPDDLVISINFDTDDALIAGQAIVEALLCDAPCEFRVGRFVAVRPRAR